MSANVRGEEEIYSKSSLVVGDSGAVLSMGSHVDMTCPPRKLSCVTGPGINSSSEMSAIDVLPEECLQEIFTRMAGPERSISACVSKRWLMLLASIRRSELKNLNVGNLDPEMSSEDLEIKGLKKSRSVEGTKATNAALASIAISTSSRGGLGKLSIKRTDSTQEVLDVGLTAIARHCPLLRSLSLWSAASIHDNSLLEMAKECRRLKQLDLCYCPSISHEGLLAIAQSSPDLSSITIQSCANIGDESLRVIAKYCPNLQSIAIKGCTLVSDQGVAGVLTACTLLTTVKLQALNITDFSVTILGCYGKAITSLMLSGLQNVSAEGFWVMGNEQGLKKVESLNISCCKMTDLSLRALVKGCPELKHLTLRKCCFASDSGFSAFERVPRSPGSAELEYRKVTQVGIFNAVFTARSKLKSLAIVKCMGIKELQTEFPIINRSQTLHSVSIRSCHGIGTTSLPIISRINANIRHLDFSGLNQITDTDFLRLVDSCNTELTKVDLSHCTNLTDEVVYALAMYQYVEKLNLNGCHLITDASLVRIGQHCRVLKELDVSNCTVTDYGVYGLTTGGAIHKLKSLSLSGCSMISDDSIPDIERLEPILLHLNIHNCSSITTNMVASLTEKLPRCKIIS